MGRSIRYYIDTFHWTNFHLKVKKKQNHSDKILIFLLKVSQIRKVGIFTNFFSPKKGDFLFKKIPLKKHKTVQALFLYPRKSSFIKVFFSSLEKIKTKQQCLAHPCKVKSVIIGSSLCKVAWFLRAYYCWFSQSRNLTSGWNNNNSLNVPWPVFSKHTIMSLATTVSR